VAGMGVLRAPIRMMGGQRAQKVKVDAMHGFRPG
jgi:hypothetical protein